MLGKIFIKDLLIPCHIGTSEKEKNKPQDILINIELTADTDEAVAGDDINKTVDYYPIYLYILEIAKTSQFTLLETLAHTITNYILINNGRVQQATVRVEKPHKFKFIKSVGVEITRIQKY